VPIRVSNDAGVHGHVVSGVWHALNAPPYLTQQVSPAEAQT